MPTEYSCTAHPKYMAKRKPMSFCEACWFVWFFRHGTSPVIPMGVKMVSGNVIALVCPSC